MSITEIKNPAVKVEVTLQDLTKKVFLKTDDPKTTAIWILIAVSPDDNLASLTGNLINDAYLLKVLDAFITDQFLRYNKLEPKPKPKEPNIT